MWHPAAGRGQDASGIMVPQRSVVGTPLRSYKMTEDLAGSLLPRVVAIDVFTELEVKRVSFQNVCTFVERKMADLFYVNIKKKNFIKGNYIPQNKNRPGHYFTYLQVFLVSGFNDRQ